MVEGGNVLHHVKREGKSSCQGELSGEYVRGICPGESPDPVHGQCRHPLPITRGASKLDVSQQAA